VFVPIAAISGALVTTVVAGSVHDQELEGLL
jgi:hypothetical protein